MRIRNLLIIMKEDYDDDVKSSLSTTKSLQFFAKWNNFLRRVTQQKQNKTKWMDLNLYWQKKGFILIICVGESAIQECFYWFKARFEYMWKVISLSQISYH